MTAIESLDADQVAAYLDRLDVDASGNDLDALRILHWAHLRAVPFENLDIRPLRRTIDLDLRSIYDKIVKGRRGGFCYEVNGLFAAPLRAIGIPVELRNARFIDADGGLSQPFDHLALVVRLPGEHVDAYADVGIGRAAPAFPLPLRDGLTIERERETGNGFRVERTDDAWRIWLRPDGDDWKPHLHIDDRPRALSEFAQACRHQETESAFFTASPICMRAIEGGRITLVHDLLTHVIDGQRIEERLTADAVPGAIWRHFGIDLRGESAWEHANHD